MKAILGLRRRHYVARVSIFLIAAALIAGMAGCGGGERGVVKYDLTITSTSGGSVTTPGEGTFTYKGGTAVNLVATPDTGYHFVSWTGNVGTIVNVNAASTTITMNGTYSITANFSNKYALTVSSTTGGNVTTPGEGTFTYDSGTVVNLVATPDAGCHFVNWTGNVSTIGNTNASSTTITMNDDYSITADFEYTPMVAAGALHTVGLKSDGTVVAVGSNSYGQSNVSGWTGIIQIAAGAYHTVGLKSDGRVVAVGKNDCGQCNVSGWTDIIQVAAGYLHTVGLKSDGTVVAAGNNSYGQCNVGGWTGIIQVAAGVQHTVGLKLEPKTGYSVIAVGDNSDGQCNIVQYRTDIVQVTAGGGHTLWLHSDGTVAAVGTNSDGQCNVGGWDLSPLPAPIASFQIAAGATYTVGLKNDGTVAAVGSNYWGQCNVGGWTGVVQVATVWTHTVGLNFDGTVVAVGRNLEGQCNVSGWDLH